MVDGWGGMGEKRRKRKRKRKTCFCSRRREREGDLGVAMSLSLGYVLYVLDVREDRRQDRTVVYSATRRINSDQSIA